MYLQNYPWTRVTGTGRTQHQELIINPKGVSWTRCCETTYTTCRTANETVPSTTNNVAGIKIKVETRGDSICLAQSQTVRHWMITSWYAVVCAYRTSKKSIASSATPGITFASCFHWTITTQVVKHAAGHTAPPVAGLRMWTPSPCIHSAVRVLMAANDSSVVVPALACSFQLLRWPYWKMLPGTRAGPQSYAFGWSTGTHQRPVNATPGFSVCEQLTYILDELTEWSAATVLPSGDA